VGFCWGAENILKAGNFLKMTAILTCRVHALWAVFSHNTMLSFLFLAIQ